MKHSLRLLLLALVASAAFIAALVWWRVASADVPDSVEVTKTRMIVCGRSILAGSTLLPQDGQWTTVDLLDAWSTRLQASWLANAIGSDEPMRIRSAGVDRIFGNDDDIVCNIYIANQPDGKTPVRVEFKPL